MDKLHRRRLKFVFIIFVLLSAGCFHKPNRLEEALAFAGENRAELEKVLEHYKEDSLKYRAACFLIENMPRWYGYEGWQLDTLHSLMAKQRQGILTTQEKQKWKKFDYRTLNKVYDAKVITSSFLITNIDMAFKEWQTRPWNRTLPFNDFCELILPYRIGNERLSEWRMLYSSYYGHLLDSLYNGSDVLEACKIINNELNRQGCKYCTDWSVPHHDAEHLFNTRIGYCRENSDLIVYAMRACGIPVAADFMPYSPDYRYSHEWNVVRDTTGKYIQFGFDGLSPQRHGVRSDGRKKGKIYRYCYSKQKEREELLQKTGWNIGGDEGLYWKDVTAEYFGNNEAVVDIDTSEHRLFGLSVFSTEGWQVIGEGVRINEKKVLFRNIQPSLIFVPVSLGDEIRQVGYPFMIDSNGNVKIFSPNKTKLEEVLLTRKMPLIPRIAAWGYSQIGARIEADINAGFTRPRLITEIKDTMRYTFQLLRSEYIKPVKYIRYIPPKGLLQLAELKLYEDTTLQSEIKMYPLSDTDYANKVIDGDILSYVYRKSSDISPLLFKLDNTKSINAIYYVARTDDNYVWEGDTYELLYNDGPSGWKSLGEKVAKSNSIMFNTPSNALLWLRDKTKGKEEQVFIFRHNRQWFNSDF